MAEVFLSKQTASSTATISFTSGIDSTYSEYLFVVGGMHPASDGTILGWQVNADGQSGYNEVIQSTNFYGQMAESGDSGMVHIGVSDTYDQTVGTAFQPLTGSVGSDADQSGSGQLRLFNPAGTTFNKKWVATSSCAVSDNTVLGLYTAGYINTTSAIDEVQFKFASGNMDSGTITLYGVG